MADMMKTVGKGKGGMLGRMMGGLGIGGGGGPQIDPAALEQMSKGGLGGLPGGLPGGFGGLPRGLTNGLGGLPGLGGPKLPGLPGLPGKKK